MKRGNASMRMQIMYWMYTPTSMTSPTALTSVHKTPVASSSRTSMTSARNSISAYYTHRVRMWTIHAPVASLLQEPVKFVIMRTQLMDIATRNAERANIGSKKIVTKFWVDSRVTLLIEMTAGQNAETLAATSLP